MAVLKVIKNTKGAVFITVIIISMLMIFIAVSASNMLLQDAHMIKHLKRSIQAQHLAEAGISDALAVLLDKGFSAKDTAANFPKTNLGAGWYDVTVEQSGTRVLLSSEGVAGGVSRTVTVEVESLYPEALERALATGSDLDFKANKGDIIINGDIHANGNLTLTEQHSYSDIEVHAHAPATGKATSNGTYSPDGAYIQDTANSGGGKPMLSFPNFNFGYLKTVAQASGEHYSSSQNFPDGTALTGGTAGITYVEGYANFNGTCTITGGFVATGDISIENKDKVTQTHDTNGNRFPIFISGNHFKSYGEFNTEQGNIVYATNSIKIQTPSGTPTVLGCVVSGGWISSTANADMNMTYYKVEASEVVPEGIEVVSWNR